MKRSLISCTPVWSWRLDALIWLALQLRLWNSADDVCASAESSCAGLKLENLWFRVSVATRRPRSLLSSHHQPSRGLVTRCGWKEREQQNDGETQQIKRRSGEGEHAVSTWGLRWFVVPAFCLKAWMNEGTTKGWINVLWQQVGGAMKKGVCLKKNKLEMCSLWRLGGPETSAQLHPSTDGGNCSSPQTLVCYNDQHHCPRGMNHQRLTPSVLRGETLILQVLLHLFRESHPVWKQLLDVCDTAHGHRFLTTKKRRGGVVLMGDELKGRCDRGGCWVRERSS